MEATSHGQGKAFLRWCVIAAGMTFLLQLWLCRSLIKDYFPTADEVALEAASTDVGGKVSASYWFTQGFHSYFDSFPEWRHADTDFWRPLANFLFWLNYQIFGTIWSSQLIFGYLIHAVMVGISGYVAYRVFDLRVSLAATAMLISAFNPALWSVNSLNYYSYSLPELIQFPIYQTEILCSLLMMGAFLSFIRSRFALFCLFATIALLLKETSLTVPVTAIALIGAWWRPEPRTTAKNLVWLILPLAIWYVARTLTFDYGRSVYVLPSGTHWAWLLKPIRNLLYLPTTLYLGPLSETKNALLMREPGLLLANGFQLAANAAWWLALLYAVLRLCKIAGPWFIKPPAPWMSGLVFALGNLGLVLILQNPEPRLAYFWFSLGPAAVFSALPNKRLAVGFGIALGATLVLPQAWSLTRSFSADSIWDYAVEKQSARQLTALLGQLPASVSTVYLIDELTLQGTAPAYLAKFAGFRGKIVVVNSIQTVLGCKQTDDQATRYQLHPSVAGTQLNYSAPRCFAQLKPTPLKLFDEDKKVQRGQWMNYQYPELTVSRASSILAMSDEYDPGRHWTVTVNDPACSSPGACVWLGFDAGSRAYFRVNEGS